MNHARVMKQYLNTRVIFILWITHFEETKPPSKQVKKHLPAFWTVEPLLFPNHPHNTQPRYVINIGAIYTNNNNRRQTDEIDKQ